MRTSEKRRWQMAKKEFLEGGRLEGHTQQGLQEERINSNHCAQDPAGAALYSFMQAQAAMNAEAAERQAAGRAEWKAARKAAREAAREALEAEEAGRTTSMSRAATGCGRSKGSASSTREDELRALLRALLADKRSMRAPVGRRPAVFRRPAFRSKHVALASELFRQSPEAGIEELIHSLAEGWLAQLNAMPASERAAVLGAVDGGSGEDDGAAVRAEGEGVRRARG